MLIGASVASFMMQLIGSFSFQCLITAEMRILMFILIFQRLISKLHCDQIPHVDHICSDGVTTEQAGMGSGTLTFGGNRCEIIITDIPELRNRGSDTINQVSRLNIIGVRRNESCSSTPILIDSETYCADESVKDTVINVTDQQMKFALVSTQADSFTLRYYRGEPFKFDGYFLTS